MDGLVQAGFEKVADAFLANFAERGDVGAACCVYLDGSPVVDVWDGWADRDAGRAWDRHTLQLAFSASKGPTAACVHLLGERGALDVDAPVAASWPEFGANGKESITVRQVLSHRAGLAAVDGDLTLEQVLAWDPVVAAIAAQAPNWEPGTRHGYHARSFGWVLGEVVRRVSGRSIGRFFADEIASPLGLEWWIGLPADLEPRVSMLYPPDDLSVMDAMSGSDTLFGRVMAGPSGLFRYDEMWNRGDVHAAEIPSSNGIATARSVARLYAALVGEVDGVRLLRPETIAAACEVQSDGPDAVIGLPTTFGLGFQLPPSLVLGARPSAFGHAGAGGSVGLADRKARLGFGYVMNKMSLGLEPDLRAPSLVEAAYACL